jgi:uncharacterized phage-associated protein
VWTDPVFWVIIGGEEEGFAMNTVFDVAERVLEKCGSLTTMKLQKLCYYCQAWSLAWDDEPLFDEDFEAWANGPVCVPLFEAHKGMFRVGPGFFAEKASPGAAFSDAGTESMDAVIMDYGDKDPHWLSDLTHNEDPWRDAREGFYPGQPCHNIIEKESMRQYYGGLSTR